MSRVDISKLSEALVLGTILFVYSNGLALWANSRGKYPEVLFRRLNPALIFVMLAYAVRRQGGLASVGLQRKGLRRSLLGGVGLGALLSGPPLFFFHKPLLLDTPLEYGPISRMTGRELLKDVLIDMPIGIAVLEELAFRGLLFSSIRTRFPAKWAIAGSAGGFAAWHLTVTATSAAQSNLSTAARLPSFLKPFVLPIAVVGGMLTTGVAGVMFAWLRERTGNLVGPIIAHWLVDGVMIAALWIRRGPTAGGETMCVEL